MDLPHAVYVLVRWAHVRARERIDPVVTAPAPHYVPRIVAYGTNVIVAWARINLVRPVAGVDIVFTTVAAYDVRLRGLLEAVGAVVAVDGFRERYPADHHQHHQRHHQRQGRPSYVISL